MMMLVDALKAVIDKVRKQVIQRPLVARLVRGAFWSMTGAAISRGLLFLSTIIVARILGKYDYGRLDIVQNTILTFQVFTGFGLGLMATKFIAEFHRKDPLKTGRIIALSSLIGMTTGLIGALIMLILAQWLATDVLADAQLQLMLRVGAISIFFSAMNGAQTGALAGFEAFKAIAKINTIAGILSFPMIAGGVYFGGLYGAVWGFAASQFTNWLINHLVLRSVMAQANISMVFRGLQSELPNLWGFALPTILSEVLVTPVNWICRTLLVNQPDGFAELGLYAAGLQVATIISSVVIVLGAPLLPILSEQRLGAKSETAQYYNIFFFWMLSLVMVLPLMAFPEVIGWLFGSQFAGRLSNQVFSLILFFTLINSFKRGLGNAVVAAGLMWWSFASNAFWGILVLSLFSFLVKYGALGFAISMTIAY
ncbi:MAG: oligosaccharide flippase family protein, partial [Anaerolineales bacterium]|nr:oligosaccharide flippase family protein [Anaerolineales bacterium]